jgi:hypothetical protein
MKVKSSLYQEAKKSLSQTRDTKATFKTKKNGVIVLEKQPLPAGPASENQTIWRDKYRTICASWNALTPEQQDAYKPAANARGITAFNQYLSEQLLLKSKTTTYTLEGIAANSETHRAAYLAGLNVADNTPPNTKPFISGAWEVPTSDYQYIAYLDSNWADISTGSYKVLQWFSFVVDVPVNLITTLKLTWVGHASSKGVAFYVYNFSTHAWQLVAANNATSDWTATFEEVNHPENFVGQDRRTFSVAITRTNASILELIYTNFVKLEVTHCY